jgi:predicted unusual protein kinase regulating ubiquinone biosynthesis (AarF/ABC1/UbiB family)
MHRQLTEEVRQEAMAMELDLEIEARNAARTAHLIRHRRDVCVPQVNGCW